MCSVFRIPLESKFYRVKEEVMKVVLYARVSSKEQAEGYSIPAQLDLLREYAKKNGFEIVKEFTEAETAKQAGRPSFNEMISLLYDDKSVRAVLVEKTDRLYRNFKDWVRLDYEEMGVEVHLVKENEILSKESKSHQKFIHGIKVLMAKNFIDNLSEETKKGMYKKLESGGFPFIAPLGYKNDPLTHEVVIDEEYAPYVRKMFSYFATGRYSLKGLNEKMYEEGLVGRRSKKKLNRESTKRVLTNHFYYGEIRVKGEIYQGHHEPLISKELFDIVQPIVESVNKPRVNTRHFAFTGFIKCGHCGCGITAQQKTKASGRNYVYYHCTDGRGECSNLVYLREDKLCEQFGNYLKSLVIPEEMIELTRKALLESHKDEKEYHEKALKNLSHELDKLQRMIDACYEDKVMGKIDNDFWERQTGLWKKKQSDVIASINFHKQANTKYLSKGVELLELAKNAFSLYEKQTPEEKRRLLETMVSNSRLVNGSVEFFWKKPFDLIAERSLLQKWGAKLSQYRNFFIKYPHYNNSKIKELQEGVKTENK